MLKNQYTRMLHKKMINFRLRIKYIYLKTCTKTEMVKFCCNICGKHVTAPKKNITDREKSSCYHCGATLRFRSIIHILSMSLYNKSLAIKDFPHGKDYCGIGMSDSDSYAIPLARKLNYTNTFYHRAPFLDICKVKKKDCSQYDFIISSDVLEHVPPPVGKAFTNIYKLLKPGGVCIFTVPFRQKGEYKEHFPDLYDYNLKTINGEVVLINTTKNGEVQKFENLRFHGGAGTTLEMRDFTLDELKYQINKAGFKDLTIHQKDYPDYGIIWNQKQHIPMSMRRI